MPDYNEVYMLALQTYFQTYGAVPVADNAHAYAKRLADLATGKAAVAEVK